MRVLLSLFLLLGPFLEAATFQDRNHVETQIDDYSYSITFIKRKKEAFETAKHSALVYAAKLGNKKNFNYFTLDSTEEVTVTLSKSEIFPGLKIFVTFSYERPSQGEIYEVCNLIFCR